MLDILDDALGFQPPPPIYQKIAILEKGAKKLISNFFALKLYISWEAGTPKKLEDLLQQCWRLYKLTVTPRGGVMGFSKFCEFWVHPTFEWP